MQNFKTQLVLLPGLDGTGMLFRPLQDVLERDMDCTIVAYPSTRELDLTQLAAVVLKQLSQTDTANAIVVAESFSGLVALAVLAQSKIPIGGFVFVGAFAEPPRRLLPLLSGLFRVLAPLLPVIPDFLIRRYCLGADAKAADLDRLRQAIRKVSPAVLAQRMRLIAAEHSFGKVRFDVPCCYIRAKEDRLVPASAVHWFEHRFKSVHIEEVQGPHFVLQARPRECAEAIERAARWITAGHRRN